VLNKDSAMWSKLHGHSHTPYVIIPELVMLCDCEESSFA